MYEKDYLMPKLCMTRTINLSNTKFRYQLVFFVHIYGYIWLADGYLWHLLPRQYVFPGCMIWLIQRFEWCNMF